MNLVSFRKEISDEGALYVSEFRKHDMQKLDYLINDIFSKIHELNPEYSYSMVKETDQPGYVNYGSTYMDNFIVSQKFNEFENKIEIYVPKLVQDNYFILNNILYIPLLFLEKSPIDRMVSENKIFANINGVFNFTLNFDENIIQFRNKKMDLKLFFKVFFADDKEYLEELTELDLIHKKTGERPFRFTKEELKKVIDFLGFHKTEFFYEIMEKEGTIANFCDKFLLLEYYRDIFDDYYGIRTLPDIFKKIVQIYKDDVQINMANIENRRVVMLEYLIKPIFDIYVRLLYGAIDKTNQNFLASMNKNSILTKGFHTNMHKGNLYDLSLPYPLPMINKVSQDISIISNGRLPKSWTENNPNSFGKICPISVSAAKTALNLVFTSSTKINVLGRIL